jgi:hypothetical protein
MGGTALEREGRKRGRDSRGEGGKGREEGRDSERASEDGQVRRE